MSYTALYRKLRPKNFKSIIGQAHIVRTLKNQIATGRVSHAYLFCGTRGTGKTSTAKIFAKAINCNASIDAEACNSCTACKAIEGGYSMNIIEIDAASNNGVENIRDIREEVQYPPAEGKYKIYIIDEVHMLSTGAFNALLKTLEEPPAHVIFILATTDPQKIPSTIHSRCQRFDFKRISSADMVEALLEYMEDEKVEIERDALQYIARLSDGAMRDALSILDQCTSFYYNETITVEKVRELVGSVDIRIFYALTDALNAFDSRECLSIINDLVINGRDIGQFTAELISHFRNLMVALSVREGSLSLDILSDNMQRLREQAEKIDRPTLLHYINTFSLLQNQIKYAANERILLEVTCIRLCNPAVEGSSEALEPRLKKIENMLNTGHTVQTPVSRPPVVSEERLQKTKKALPEDIQKVKSDWKDLIAAFPAPANSFLSKTDIGYLDGNILYIVAKQSDYIQKYASIIKEELIKRYEREFDIAIISDIEYDKRHKKHYGVSDEDLDEELKDAFTDIQNMDIIYN